MSAHQIDNITVVDVYPPIAGLKLPELRIYSEQRGPIFLFGEEAIRNLRAACDAALGEGEEK